MYNFHWSLDSNHKFPYLEGTIYDLAEKIHIPLQDSLIEFLISEIKYGFDFRGLEGKIKRPFKHGNNCPLVKITSSITKNEIF